MSTGETTETTETTETKPTLKELIETHGLQDQVNSMMADNRKKLTQQNQELVNQLESLKQNSRLTQEERDELQNRITSLEEQYMTKEELSKREATKQQKQYEDELNKIKSDQEKWQSMYSTETIDRTLQDAAIEAEALHPSQIIQMFRGNTQLTEVIKDGAPTGKYAPVVKFNDINDEGAPVMLELTPQELLKRLKELPQYQNLFKGTATGGLGETSGSLANQPKLQELLNDPAKYAKWRKENPDLDISKLKR